MYSKYKKRALVVSPTAATFYFYMFFSATFSGTFSAIFSGTFSGTQWTWLAFAPRLAGTFSGTFSGTLLNLTWLLHQSLRNLPRNWLCTKASQASPGPSPEPDPVEPDPALHQPATPSLATFSGTLLNLTRLCTKACLLRMLNPDLAFAPKPPRPSPEASPEPSPEPAEPDLALRQSLPDLLRNLGTFSGTSLNLTRRLHQCTPELLWAEDPISIRCWGKRDPFPILGNLRNLLVQSII